MPRDELLGKLRWRCRRGMREVDVLLERWLETHYASASEARKQAFHRALDSPDTELAAWLFGREQPPDVEMAGLIHQIVAGQYDR